MSPLLVEVQDGVSGQPDVEEPNNAGTPTVEEEEAMALLASSIATKAVKPAKVATVVWSTASQTSIDGSWVQPAGMPQACGCNAAGATKIIARLTGAEVPEFLPFGPAASRSVEHLRAERQGHI